MNSDCVSVCEDSCSVYVSFCFKFLRWCFIFCDSFFLVSIIYPFSSVASVPLYIYISTPSFACSLLHLPLHAVVVACPFACPAFPVLLLHHTLPSFPPLLLRCSRPGRGCQMARRLQDVCPRLWSVSYLGAVPASQHSLPALYVSVLGWNRSVLMGRASAAHSGTGIWNSGTGHTWKKNFISLILRPLLGPIKIIDHTQNE